MTKYLSLLLCLFSVVFCSSGADAQIIYTIAGKGITGYTGDGLPATDATLDSTSSIITDGSGNLYLNDELNYCVRMVNASGIITTVAGKDSLGYTGDNGPATNATFSNNWGITIDPSGNLYVADQNNYVVRKVAPASGGTITTLAGTGHYGTAGDGGPASAAELKTPLGIASDYNGNIFIGDQDFCGVRKVDGSGTISRYAGGAGYGYFGDGGPATLAKFSKIYGLATDRWGNLYVCDGENNRVRMVTTMGVVTTVAGNGSPGFMGDGGPAISASLNHPLGVCVSDNGDIYIADSRNNRIRKVDPAGNISTFAGTGFPGFGGDGGPALAADLYGPISVAMDADENIYVSDMDNVRIRKIIKSLAFTGGHHQHITVCENSAAAPVNTVLTIKDFSTGLNDTCELVAGPVHGSADVYYVTTATGGTFTPAGMTYSPAVGYSGQDSFRVAVRNGMNMDTTNIYVTVIPSVLSAGVITGASNVCVGAAINLTDSAMGGVWTTGSGKAMLSPVPFGCVVTGMYAGTDTVFYTVSNTCGTARASKIIVVNTLPDPGVIFGPKSVCKGSQIKLNNAAPDGVWSVTNSCASVNSGIVDGLLPGLDTVRYTVANTWCKATASFTVHVDTFPTAGIITGRSVICVGAVDTLSDSVGGGVWSTKDTMVILDSGRATGVAVGIATVSYSVTNACGTAVAKFVINVGAQPEVPVITEHESVFYAPAGYSSYQWTLNGQPITGANADSFAAISTGDYAVIVTNVNGCSTASLPQTYSGCGADDIKLYPNPTSEVVNIQWCKRMNIRILCEDGRLVSRIKDTDMADLTALPDGVYFISIYDRNGIYVKTKRVTKISQK